MSCDTEMIQIRVERRTKDNYSFDEMEMILEVELILWKEVATMITYGISTTEVNIIFTEMKYHLTWGI